MTTLARTLKEQVFYPAHDPRKASAEYARVHKHLVVTLDEPCWICGVKHSDVKKMNAEDVRAFTLETHHSELEWAAEMAFETDPVMLEKIVADLNGATPQEHLASLVSQAGAIVHGGDAAALREFLDSEGNMLVLCATHHRGVYKGIHSITYPAWKLQRYEHKDGFQFITGGGDVA